MMSIVEFFIYLCIIILIVLFLISNTSEFKKKKNEKTLEEEKDHLMDYYFSNYLNLNRLPNKKIFIHIPYEKNERKWINFGSRSSKELNNDLIVSSIRSIIRTCKDKYSIILYDNTSIKELINEPDDEDLCNIRHPEMLSGVDLKQWESYCKAKIIYKYGGIIINPYFIFKKCPNESILFPELFTITHLTNEGFNSSNKEIIPSSCYFMSAPREDNDVKIYIKYLEYLCTKHYTVDHKKFDKSFESLYALNSYDPKLIGCMDKNSNIIYTNDLMSHKDIHLDYAHFCLFINMDIIKKNRNFNWILKLDEDEIKESNTFIGKYINNL